MNAWFFDIVISCPYEKIAVINSSRYPSLKNSKAMGAMLRVI